MVGVVLVFSDASESYRGAASWRATRRVFAPARRCRPTGAGCKTNNFASRTSKAWPMTGWRRRPRCTWARHPAGLRAFSKSFRGSHWNAIGMSGSSGCAALARAHASSRGAKTPGSSARCHSNPAVKCLAGPSTAHRALHHPGKVLVPLQKTLNRLLRYCRWTSSRSTRALCATSASSAPPHSSRRPSSAWPAGVSGAPRLHAVAGLPVQVPGAHRGAGAAAAQWAGLAGVFVVQAKPPCSGPACGSWPAPG